MYKCLQKKTKTPAAVKIFDLSKGEFQTKQKNSAVLISTRPPTPHPATPEAQAKIKREVHKEVSILQSLRHDRIVQVYDLFEGKVTKK